MRSGEIWWAKVAFEDQEGWKERPVLITSKNQALIVAYKITSKNRGNTAEEFEILEWKKAGLPKPSFIRLGKMLRLTEDVLTEKIGKLTVGDTMRLEFRIASRI